MKIKTVKINNNGEPLIINATDFRHGSDELWIEEDSVEGQNEPQTEVEETEVEVLHKGGGRWIVLVGGEQVHEGTLDKVDAQALAAEY